MTTKLTCPPALVEDRTAFSITLKRSNAFSAIAGAAVSMSSSRGGGGVCIQGNVSC